MNRHPGVFCLENSWADDGKDLTDKTSVEQQLRMLESAEQIGSVIHRDVATMPEFQVYLKEWSKPKYRKYPLAYMAFHGSAGAFRVGGTDLYLEQLADLIGPGHLLQTCLGRSSRRRKRTLIITTGTAGATYADHDLAPVKITRAAKFRSSKSSAMSR